MFQCEDHRRNQAVHLSFLIANVRPFFFTLSFWDGQVIMFGNRKGLAVSVAFFSSRRSSFHAYVSTGSVDRREQIFAHGVWTIDGQGWVSRGYLWAPCRPSFLVFFFPNPPLTIFRISSSSSSSIWQSWEDFRTPACLVSSWRSHGQNVLGQQERCPKASPGLPLCTICLFDRVLVIYQQDCTLWDPLRCT